MTIGLSFKGQRREQAGVDSPCFGSEQSFMQLTGMLEDAPWQRPTGLSGLILTLVRPNLLVTCQANDEYAYHIPHPYANLSTPKYIKVPSTQYPVHISWVALQSYTAAAAAAAAL